MNTKKLLIIICILANQFINSANAQAPQSFNYQAVARDGTGAVLSNQAVSFRISLLQGSVTGTNVYSETHPVTTNQFGLVNFAIGGGTLVSGSFANINWAQGPYFVQVELDATGGSTYVIMNTTQLLSVPYALYAEKSGNPTLQAGSGITIQNDSIINTAQNQQINLSGTGQTNITGTYPNYVVNTPNIQAGNGISVTGQTIANTGDLSDTNEIQQLTLTDDTLLSLSNGGGTVVLPFNTRGLRKIYLAGDYTQTEFNTLIQSMLGPETEEITLYNLSNVNTLNFPSITKLYSLSIQNCTGIQSIALNNLVNCYSGIAISGNINLNSINFPSLLKNFGGISIENNVLLQVLNLSSLTYCNSLSIKINPLLSNINLGLLQNCESLNININIGLSSVNLGSYSRFFSASLVGNNLSSITINSILGTFVSIVPAIQNREIYLQNQNPPAPPTGQGLTNKQILINNGNIVTTD